MSASNTQFKAFALPADSVPPTTVASTSHNGGTSRAARNMTGTVVSSSSSMMRGFVSATYAPTTAAGCVRDTALSVGPTWVSSALTSASLMLR
jgi:hypothetical protein